MRCRLAAMTAGLAFGITALALVVASPAQNRNVQATPTTVPGSKPASRTLDLDRAIATAIENSKGLRVSAQGVIKARGRVLESRAAFVPTLNLDATVTRLDEGVTASFGDQEIPIARQLQKSFAVTAAVPIDVAGLIRSANLISDYQFVASQLDYNRTRNQLVQDVTTGYLDVLRAKAFTKVAEQALRNAHDRVKTVDAYLRAGTGTKFDVLRAQTEAANGEQNLITARNRVSLATAALNNALGLDQNTPLEIADIAETGSAPAKDFGPALDEAYRTRPEVHQADLYVRAAERGVYLAERSLLPSIALALNAQMNPDSGAFSRNTSWAAVAKISVPLFDGGLTGARAKQAKADVQSAKLGKQQVLDGVALDARQAFLNHLEATERLNVTTTALTMAEEQYRLAQVRFGAGVTLVPGASPLLEVSDAQTALTQAQTNAVNAQYDVLAARARLERALGRYAYAASASPGLSRPLKRGVK